MPERCDVAIVGYGPTGQTLAILLAQRGWRVTVLERWPTRYPLPRANHFDHEVARILQAAGVGDELRRISESFAHYEWRNAAGETLLRFNLEESGLSGWPDASTVHQPDLERLLDARARSLSGVTVRRGYEVFQIEQRSDSVRVRAQSACGEECDVEARWVVGCDGANSFVRRAMRVPIEEAGEFDWLIVDVITRAPRARHSANWQLCDPERPTTLVTAGPGRRRFEFMRLPDESRESLEDEAAAWLFLAPWGLTPANTSIERHAVYTFRARWAESWRDRRVLIAGDAAHLLPPFLSQGLGSGLRDAMTLGWKLDLVLRGQAAEQLLDTYTHERLRHVRSFIDMSLTFGRVIAMTNRDEAETRDAELVALTRAGERGTLTPPVMGPGTVLAGDPNAGQLFAQGRVRAGAREGLFDDVVGRGWVLLACDGDPTEMLDAEHGELFASLGGVTAHVGPGGLIEDLDSRYERFFERAGVRAVLVRPDFHVFGTAKGAGDVNALVRALARELVSPTVPADD